MLISEALEGKFVKSSKGQGVIQFADKREDIYGLGEGTYAYACKVRPHNVYGYIPKPDFYTTVYVTIDGN